VNSLTVILLRATVLAAIILGLASRSLEAEQGGSPVTPSPPSSVEPLVGPKCPQPTSCAIVMSPTQFCVKNPTSLFPVHGEISADGFGESSSHCGTYECFPMFRCSCGPFFTTGDVCTGDP
jgi:hypothetical protein